MRRAALLALLLSACSNSPKPAPQDAGPSYPLQAGSPWPKFRANAAQTGLGTIHHTATDGAQWSFTTGGGIFSSPIVAADGTVYFGSADQSFYALYPDGGVRWTIATGNIIDSAGLLDDEGRLYFGSGDGFLRSVDPGSGQVYWKFAAEAPAVTGAYINWFEGNVAIGPSGLLYAPNDNDRVYAVDRKYGATDWEEVMPDQTWSLPAVDAVSGQLYLGNNNLLSFLGNNIFALAPDGGQLWSTLSLGTVAASPLLTGHEMIVGGFDGYARAYAVSDGGVLWALPTRDHIYSSPAQLPDGTIVQPSVDGTIYAVSPADGSLVWAYDTGAPVRSSPAVDADGVIYVGGGDGRLYVLNPDGGLRFSMLLIDDVRCDMNSSPALGANAVYLGGASGQLFSVPYDWCLQPANAGDPRCETVPPVRSDGATLSYVNAFGETQPAVPAAVDSNAPITLILTVRQGGRQQLANLDSSSVQVTVDPPSPVAVTVSGDGKFLSVTPTVAFPAGPLSVSVAADYLENFQRAGLQLSGGEDAGSVGTVVSTAVSPSSGGAMDAGATYEISRLSLPLPTILPSYNEIGFDALHYLLGTAESQGSTGVAWMVGARLPDGGGPSQVDPETQAIFAMGYTLAGDAATMVAPGGLTLSLESYTVNLQSFRLAARFLPGGAPTGTVELSGSAICGELGIYGSYFEQLGLCNPQTGVIEMLGAANSALRTDLGPPPDAGMVTFSEEPGSIDATVAGSQIEVADHLSALLVVDATTGLPVPLDYGTATTLKTALDGTLSGVSIPTSGLDAGLPASMRVHLMVDTASVAEGTLP